MQYDKRGRMVKTVEEAESYIRYFIAVSRSLGHERFSHAQMEYDLYLPWLAEVVENILLPEDIEPTPTPVLERLYMEAAWTLCMAGQLRPGPIKAGFDNARDAYGKGFSLTYRGEEWIQALPAEDSCWSEILADRQTA
jgi:hypothetical protein